MSENASDVGDVFHVCANCSMRLISDTANALPIDRRSVPIVYLLRTHRLGKPVADCESRITPDIS